MTIPYPGLEPAEPVDAPDIISGMTDCLGAHGRFVLFGAIQKGIPYPGHVGCVVYAVREDVLVFTQIAWCDVEDVDDEEKRERALVRHATDAAVERVDTEAFEIGDVYLTQVS